MQSVCRVEEQHSKVKTELERRRSCKKCTCAGPVGKTAFLTSPATQLFFEKCISILKKNARVMYSVFT